MFFFLSFILLLNSRTGDACMCVCLTWKFSAWCKVRAEILSTYPLKEMYYNMLLILLLFISLENSSHISMQPVTAKI